MKAAGSTPPVSASSILAAGAASSHGRTLALSSPQPEPTSPCPQSPQKPPLERRGDVNGYQSARPTPVGGSWTYQGGLAGREKNTAPHPPLVVNCRSSAYVGVRAGATVFGQTVALARIRPLF